MDYKEQDFHHAIEPPLDSIEPKCGGQAYRRFLSKSGRELCELRKCVNIYVNTAIHMPLHCIVICELVVTVLNVLLWAN